MSDSRIWALLVSRCSLSLSLPSLFNRELVLCKIKLCCFGTQVFHMADFHEEKNVIID